MTFASTTAPQSLFNLSWYRVRRCAAGFIAALLVVLPSAHLVAQPNLNRDQWRWFEVEVLVFKHTRASELTETFPLPVEPLDLRGSVDLLTPYYAPSKWHWLVNLPTCSGTNSSAEFWCASHAEQALFPVPQLWPAANPFASIDRTGVVVNGAGGDIEQASAPFLLPASNHLFTELRQELSQRAIGQPLLHLSYRQPVFNRGDNYQVLLFGGYNFSREYDFFGFLLPTNSSLATPLASAADAPDQLARIQQLLALVDQGELSFQIGNDAQQQLLPLRPSRNYPGLPEQVFELDGLMHIYLVGNYLHIEPQLILREETTAREATPTMAAQADYALSQQERVRAKPFLRAYEFAQVRRVISHETHYFDHPKLGVVVQIRRTDLSARR